MRLPFCWLLAIPVHVHFVRIKRWRLQTDRNKWGENLRKFKEIFTTDFWVITDLDQILWFFTGFTNFDDKFGGDPVIIASQSGWRLNDDIIMSHPVSFGQLIVLNSSFCSYITAKKCKKTYSTAKHGMGQSRQLCCKNKNFECCGPFIHTIKEPYQGSKMLAANFLSGVN